MAEAALMSRVMEFYLAARGKNRRSEEKTSSRSAPRDENRQGKIIGVVRGPYSRSRSEERSSATFAGGPLWRNFSRSFEFLICPLRRAVQLV